MKIRVLSDLHLEFYNAPEESGIMDDVACDVVVLAGDIHVGLNGMQWAAETFDKPIIYVMGNHEYYDHEALELLAAARVRAAELGVHLLENDEVMINGVRFLGCALWTDFAGGLFSDVYTAKMAHSMIADFKWTRYRDGLLTPLAMIAWHTQSRQWLEQKIDPDNPAVVVTHFSPTFRGGDPKFTIQNEITAYFHNDLEYLMGDAAPVWIYGHNHWAADELIETDTGATRVVSNPLGYPGENTRFMSDYVITI